MTIDKEKLKALMEIMIRDMEGDLSEGEARNFHQHVADYETMTQPATILALLAEIERLEMDNRSLKGSCSKLGAEHAGMSRLYKKANRMQFEARQERDQLKAENEALRRDAERYRWLRDKAHTADWEFIGGQTPDAGEAEIDAARAKEANLG